MASQLRITPSTSTVLGCNSDRFPFLFQAEIEQASEKAGERRSTPRVSKKLGRSGEGVSEKGEGVGKKGIPLYISFSKLRFFK